MDESQNDDFASAIRAPFVTTTLELCTRFGFVVANCTAIRPKLLRDLIALRRLLRDAGAVGLQWIGGSFIEDCERLRQRSPADIDVFSLVFRQADTTQERWDQIVEAVAAIDDSGRHRADYSGVHRYFLDLDRVLYGDVDIITYYFSLFSHSRDHNIQKGFCVIEITSDASEDDDALDWLNTTFGTQP